jgi:hypothetical protein
MQSVCINHAWDKLFPIFDFAAVTDFAVLLAIPEIN